jgi:uncharacterized protein (DUF2147 family)
MKLKHLTAFVAFFLCTFALSAQSIVGTWKTVDDATGKAKSYVQIYEQNGKFYGKITKLLLPEDQGKLCTECAGADKGKPVEGMVIVKDLKKIDAYWGKGTIMDPKTGKVYSCYMELQGNEKMKVRGYLGLAALGRTQYWYKAN